MCTVWSSLLPELWVFDKILVDVVVVHLSSKLHASFIINRVGKGEETDSHKSVCC